jgi:hypothetical protein
MRIADCGIQNAECGMRIAEFAIRNAECGMRNTECEIDIAFRIPHSAFRIQNGFRNPHSAFRIQIDSVGSRLLIPNCKWVLRHPQLDSSRQFPKITEAGLVESQRLRSVRTSGYVVGRSSKRAGDR